MCEFFHQPWKSDNEDGDVFDFHSLASRSAIFLRYFAIYIDEKEIDAREKKRLKRKRMENQASVRDGTNLVQGKYRVNKSSLCFT